MPNRKWTKTGICENCKEYKNCEGNDMHLCNMANHELMVCHMELINDVDKNNIG